MTVAFSCDGRFSVGRVHTSLRFGPSGSARDVGQRSRCSTVRRPVPTDESTEAVNRSSSARRTGVGDGSPRRRRSRPLPTPKLFGSIVLPIGTVGDTAGDPDRRIRNRRTRLVAAGGHSWTSSIRVRFRADPGHRRATAPVDPIGISSPPRCSRSPLETTVGANSVINPDNSAPRSPI